MKINIEYNIIIFIHIETEYIKLRFIYSAKLLLTKPKINNIITPTSTPTKYNFGTPTSTITTTLTSSIILALVTSIVRFNFGTPSNSVFIIIYYSSTLGELYRALTMDDFRRDSDEIECETDDEISCDKFGRE